MLDDIRSNDGQKLDGRKQERRVPIERPLTDREVPLPQPETARVLSPPNHAWLAAELPEPAVKRGDLERDVEFWKRMAQVVETRRHVTPPTHMQQRIMDALPHSVPALITPWYRREYVITPAADLGAAGALVALTAAITALTMVLAHR